MKKIISLQMIISILLSFNVISPIVSADVYFTDVNEAHWAYESIAFATKAGWFSGYSDGSFLPNNTITRAEAMKVLTAFLDIETPQAFSSSFTDISGDEWYAKFVEAGKNLAIKEDNGCFYPNLPMTRENTIFALVKGLQLNISVEYVDQSILEVFTDSDMISDDIRPYLTIALQKSLISGYSDGTIKAKNSLTRAEFASLLYRAYKISDHSEQGGSYPIEMTTDEAQSYIMPQ